MRLPSPGKDGVQLTGTLANTLDKYTTFVPLLRQSIVFLPNHSLLGADALRCLGSSSLRSTSKEMPFITTRVRVD